MATSPEASWLLDRVSALGLRQLRWSHDFSMDACAVALGIGVFEFMEKERGRACFDARQLAALAEMFQLTPESLLEQMKQPPVPVLPMVPTALTVNEVAVASAADLSPGDAE